MTERELREFLGLSARDRELGRAANALRADHEATLRLLERRLGLSRGAVGTTHAIDHGSGAVVSALPEIDQRPGGG